MKNENELVRKGNRTAAELIYPDHHQPYSPADGVDNRIEVSEQEVDNLLATASSVSNQNREYHLAHILVSIPEAASPEQVQTAKTHAEDILTQLRDGADFSKTATAESDGQQALEGGDLGWRKSSQLPSFFTEIVTRLKTGEISDPSRGNDCSMAMDSRKNSVNSAYTQAVFQRFIIRKR